MLPTLKKLDSGGAYCFWLVCVRTYVSHFFMPAVTFEQWMLGLIISYMCSLWKNS